MTQRPQSAGDQVDSVETKPEEVCAASQIAAEHEVHSALGRDGAAQVAGQFPAVGLTSAATVHAAPAPAATAFITQWKPVITQAWINQS